MHKLKKPLYLTTATFLATCPIFFAEQAQAQSPTSSYYDVGTAKQRLRTSIATLQKSLPKTNPGQSQSALDASFQSLKAILQELSLQVNSLDTTNPVDIPAQQALLSTLRTLNLRLDHISTLQDDFHTSSNQLDQANQDLTNANNALSLATTAYNNAKAALEQATTDHQTAQTSYNEALTARDNAQQAADTAASNLADAKDAAQFDANNLQEATSNLTAAKTAYQEALDNYNDPATYIPDPNFQPLTHQVPHTVLIPHTTTTISNQGLTATAYNRLGYNNAPPLPAANETPISTTTVPNINYNWGSGNILNSNRSEDVIIKFQGKLVVPETTNYTFYISADDGDILEIDNTTLISGWWDKGGGGPTSPTIQLTQGVHDITVYFYENGGGAAITFYYQNPASPFWQVVPASMFGTSTTTTTTYEEVTTYTTEPIPNQTAPLIPDPALLLILQEKESALNLSQERYDSALTLDTNSRQTLQTAEDNFTSKNQDLNIKQDNLDTTSNELSLKVAALRTTITDYSAAEQTKTAAETNQQTATSASITAQSTYDTKASAFSSAINTTADDADALATKIDAYQPTPTPTEPTSKPDTQGPAQEGLPETISADTLTQIDFENVDPSQLSTEQVAALQEAALQTFETAEEGSAEYEAALDALYLAAEADDIVLSPELAAIPGAQAIADAINLLSNVGADMNPAKRKDAQQVVVTTVVVGQIAQAAAASTTTNRRNK